MRRPRLDSTGRGLKGRLGPAPLGEAGLLWLPLRDGEGGIISQPTGLLDRWTRGAEEESSGDDKM